MLRCVLEFLGTGDPARDRLILEEIVRPGAVVDPEDLDDGTTVLVRRAAERVLDLLDFALPSDKSLRRFYEKGRLE